MRFDQEEVTIEDHKNSGVVGKQGTERKRGTGAGADGGWGL